MAARDVLKNFNLFVDGQGYAGQVQEYTAPVLAITTDDHRAGGMDTSVPIDMGMETMESSFVLTSYDKDVLKQFGLTEGNAVAINLRGALESWDGTTTAVVHTMRGKITSMDSGTWQAGTKPTLTVTFKPEYYKLTHGGEVVHEIDVVNMVRNIGGTDYLAEIREALGI